MQRYRTPIVWSLAVLLLLAALYWAVGAMLNVKRVAAPQQRNYHLSVTAPVQIGAVPVLKATQGDTVTLTISSDKPGSIHVHGYEKMVVLRPGAQVSLTFVASQAGRFAVHLHDPDETMHGLAAIEVQPQ
jgi:FtsP/CotA-like multicopper oxidase with cupredoxin domain